VRDVNVFFLQRWYANWVPRWRPDSDTFVYIGWALGAMIIVLDLQYPGGLGMLLLRILGKELPVAGYGSLNSLHPGLSQPHTCKPEAHGRAGQAADPAAPPVRPENQQRHHAAPPPCSRAGMSVPPALHTTRDAHH